jgi:monoamine oxidase
MDDVIVVGAGLAGLRCAYEIVRRGYRARVLEARARVGGRVWSETLANGAVVERGAEFVFAHYDAFRALASTLGLGLVGTGFMTYDEELPAELGVTGRDVYDAMGVLAAHQAAVVVERRDASMAAVLAEAPVAARIKPLLRRQVEASVTAVLEDVSARWLPRTASSDPELGFAEAYRVVGGNQRLAIAMADAGPVSLSTPVVAIREAPSEVEVIAAGGQAFKARAVVIAVPPELTLRLRIEPELSPLKTTALQRVGWGAAAKYNAPIEGESPQRSAKDGRLAAAVWPNRGAGPSAVTAFAGSSPALAALRVGAGDDGWRRYIQGVLPPSAKMVDGGEATDWSRDPWTRGSYSYRRVGWTGVLEAALRSRHSQRVAFAGDFTSPEPGSMNGALLSGFRAGQEALAIL